ncbi:MAG: transketolase [Desulfovibrionales bacterium]
MPDKENMRADQLAVNVIKGLILDGVRKANSGHPGGAMSSADFAYILFKEFLEFDPDDPTFFNRDRFVLSAGHESMLLYSLLCMCGFLTLEDLMSFRQLGSRTPGHPEHDVTPGVEATTGPLGQGFGMSGGMAVAEMFLRAKLGQDILDHYTYVLSSDGDLQEPIALGSAALFGQWGLGKLIVYYDSNKIQLAGPTSRCDCADYAQLFSSLCWQVIEIDGHDHDQIREALKKGRADIFRPTLIIGHTTIAKGSATLEGNADTHGSPMSFEEIAATKEKIGLPKETEFYLPEETVTHFQSRFAELRSKASEWKKRFSNRQASDAAFADLWRTVTGPRSGISISWPSFPADTPVATRKAFGMCLNALIDQLPHMVGGSADLDPSNQTVYFRETTGCFGSDNPTGRNLCYGVREFPMAAINNGLALHGGIIPFGATFLVFSDYERNAIRMSALQKLPALYIFTHDSFWVGEDGPTHQPIEHISSLRLIPNLLVFRPADANETKHCMEVALTRDNVPSALLFSRQSLPVLDEAKYTGIAQGVSRGGYVLKDCDAEPELVVLASGSEVHHALEASQILSHRKIRVVSVPCMELFDAQGKHYHDSLLPPGVPCVAMEAGSPDLWYKYVGRDGVVIGLDHFGDSAPGKILAEKYGITTDNLVSRIKELLA